MFNLDSASDINFENFFDIHEYSDILYNNSVVKKHLCPKNISSCPCSEKPIEVRVEIENNNCLPVSCKMSCRAIEIKNGSDNLFRIVTFVDVTEQKMTEKKLIETQNQIQNIIKNYGLEKKDISVMLSLANLEINKIQNIEDI